MSAQKLTIHEYAAATESINRKVRAALALLAWSETTHGNEFGHDHHCPLESYPSKGPWVDEAGDPDKCTCGWSAFRAAHDEYT